MQHLDLSDDEAAALVALLTRTIDGDRYPFAPRIRTLRAILKSCNLNRFGSPCHRRRFMPSTSNS
jgi:hypothetical protein